jgi:hypothetical protein
MGEAKQKKSATAKLIAEFPTCYFCGGMRPSATREHMPPKSLFDNSYRPDRLIMPACQQCNNETSTADLTAAVVSRWNYDSDEQERADHKKLVAQVRRQAPALVDEWTKLTGVQRKRARRHLRDHGVMVPIDAGIATIGPLTISQLNLFAHKAVLALYFEHFKVPLPASGLVCAFWKTKEDFSRNGIPQAILDCLPDYGTLMQGKWSEHKIFEYRHAMNRSEGLFGCLARLRNGLFVIGFASQKPDHSLASSSDWIAPTAPRGLLQNARFEKKL